LKKTKEDIRNSLLCLCGRRSFFANTLSPEIEKLAWDAMPGTARKVDKAAGISTLLFWA